MNRRQQIFQKIAASSFAAVARTLRRRLIALTVHESLVHDENRDIDRRDNALMEAKDLIRAELGLGTDRLADIEVDRALGDIQRRILKKLDEEAMDMASSITDEVALAAAEDSAVASVALALPEERLRIKDLLRQFPKETETKVQKLLMALGALWRQDAGERVVIFATYLGSVEMLGQMIEREYPGQGVVVLKGGDHGSKSAAEKRFKQADGPRVMICTAAGREGLNMQHARVLFNFDLPWNPMDMEQRIGRIHRYGQKHTAQVYNLVLSDTIEGKIFLLLDEKLTQIAKTLGKVDEHGEVAEDLRSQILGQLAERLSYERLYAEALGDPELKRTRVELEAAMSNASQAQAVVFELFQDLGGFNIDEYKPLSDTSFGMGALEKFLKTALEADGKKFEPVGVGLWQVISRDGVVEARLAADRNLAMADETLSLIGLDNPIVAAYIDAYRVAPADALGISAKSRDGKSGVVTLWQVVSTTEKRHQVVKVIALAVDSTGYRQPAMEKLIDEVFQNEPLSSALSRDQASSLLVEAVEPMLHRDLIHRGLVRAGQAYEASLVGWIELS